jgi:hypothetical protein
VTVVGPNQSADRNRATAARYLKARFEIIPKLMNPPKPSFAVIKLELPQAIRRRYSSGQAMFVVMALGFAIR